MAWTTGEGTLAASNPSAEIDFDKQVLPILRAHCVKCHGGAKLEGGLDLRGYSLLVQGGDSGPAIIAGKPDNSLILEKIRSGEMPPKPDKPHGR